MDKDISIKYFHHFLESYGYSSSFYENVKKVGKNGEYIINVVNPEDYIRKAFDWLGSKEGFSYWSKIEDHWKLVFSQGEIEYKKQYRQAKRKSRIRFFIISLVISIIYFLFVEGF